ncbi:t-SNARE [Pholiota conissans]|uniref:t-SNARE n=1 Tax=Pholiota conissans TaxID=109636 RepID=A0A9P5YVQ1_9AGAR|nr:t-SNARE [Pholiota conissans]
MTTRSRTGLFLSFRDSRARYSYPDDDEHHHLIPHDAPAHLPPRWVDISDQVEDILAATQANIQALDRLHAKHVLPGFADRSQEEREIENITNSITKDFRTCQALIQRIITIPHTFPPDPHSSQHGAHAAKNVQRALAAKVQDLSASFRKKQRVYMDKLQGHATKNQDLLIASGAISLKGSDGMSAVDDDILAASHTRAQSMSQSQSLLQEDPSQDLRTRDRELSEIANSIAALAELFKDLSVLVIDQGTLLDSVEYNIEQTAVQMEDAVEELKVATKYQKSTGKRKCIFLLLLIIFGLIIVLIFKPKKHSPSPPSSPPPPAAPQTPSALVLMRRSSAKFRYAKPRGAPRT